MVVNSERAAEMWGWGHPIIHGLDPDEWWSLDKEPRVVTMISPGGLPKYYDRAFLEAVIERLRSKNIVHCHITVDWIAKDWNQYREFLGRSLVYFNPTRESPMPRSRTEACLSGCCVLSTPHHDWDKYVTNGYDGFIVKRDPNYTADLIEYLIKDYKKAKAIGARAREMAKKHFHMDRYRKNWLDLIDKVLTN
jgi:Glycosyltransferase